MLSPYQSPQWVVERGNHRSNPSMRHQGPHGRPATLCCLLGFYCFINPMTSGRCATADVRGVMVTVSTGLMAGLRSTSNVPWISFSFVWTSRRICHRVRSRQQGRRRVRTEQTGSGESESYLLDLGFVVF